MVDDASHSYLWQRRHELLFKVAVSYLYHRKRQRFFDLLDKTTRAATVLLGASLLGQAVRDHLPLVGSAISALGLLALVFGYGDRKQAHKELAESFMALRAAVEGIAFDSLDPDRVDAGEADYCRLNAKEPPALAALVTICQNEQSIALGQRDSVHPLPLHKRLLASWLSFSITT